MANLSEATIKTNKKIAFHFVAVLTIMGFVFLSKAVASNYNTTRDIINPTYATVPEKGESVDESATGASITRVTDINDASVDEPGLLVVYSRYSPTNSTGEYFLAFGEDSFSCWVYRVQDHQVMTKLHRDQGRQIGENNEIRWDYSGENPNTIYYRNGMQLFKMDVFNQEATRVLVRDFSSDFPEGVQILNDVEGDSSNNSRFWAFEVRGPYDGSRFPIIAIFTYDAVVDAILGILLPETFGKTGELPRPNMVEISPEGTKVITHYGRCWGDSSYGARPEDIGSLLDGPHAWDLNFTNPVKVAPGETHSGWAYDSAGNEMFVYQNNRNDWTEATNIHTGQTVQIIYHGDMGWRNGFHYGKFYKKEQRGWVFVNTYTEDNSDWGNNQLLMVELKDSSHGPKVWRISPNFNDYSGAYRDEAPAALSMDGNAIYLGCNWGGNLAHREVFRVDLPVDWHDILSEEGRNTVVADAGPDLFYDSGDAVMLNGTHSHCSSGTITSFTWKKGAVQIASGASPTISLENGVHALMLEVTNGTHTDTDVVIATIGSGYDASSDSSGSSDDSGSVDSGNNASGGGCFISGLE